MRPNKVKALWRQGKPAVAGWISTGNAYIAEVMAHTGYDALIIDTQHGMGTTFDQAAACLQAISTTDTVPIVRVPWNQPEYMQSALDAGAYGIIVPLVNSYEEAEKAGSACRYPPLGTRSAGRALTGYGNSICAWLPRSRRSRRAPIRRVRSR